MTNLCDDVSRKILKEEVDKLTFEYELRPLQTSLKGFEEKREPKLYFSSQDGTVRSEVSLEDTPVKSFSI